MGIGTGPLLSGVASIWDRKPRSRILNVSDDQFRDRNSRYPAGSCYRCSAPIGTGDACENQHSTKYSPRRSAGARPAGLNSDPPAIHKFDDLGRPPGEFFRVLRFKRDSDGDGVWDNDEFVGGADPFELDSDGNGVPDAYQNADTDGDGIPNSDTLHPQPIITEILSKNNGSFLDGDGEASDWLESTTLERCNPADWVAIDRQGRQGSDQLEIHLPRLEPPTFRQIATSS